MCAIYSFLNVQQLNYGRCRDGSGRRPDGSGRLLVELTSPVHDLPLTLDTIQLGMQRLAMANTSAAKNRAPDIMLSLSITQKCIPLYFVCLCHAHDDDTTESSEINQVQFIKNLDKPR